MMRLTQLEQDLIDLQESINDLHGLMKNCYFDSDIGNPHEFLREIIDSALTIKSNARHLEETYTNEQIQRSLDD